MFRLRFTRLLMVTFFTLLGLDTASAQGLGTITFPNTGAAEAQKAFINGVLMLHSFEYEDASDSFLEAQRIDPDFALAYWGESLTHYRRLWFRVDREKANTALNKFGATKEARAKRAQTDRERDYLASVANLYGDQGTQAEREIKYTEALGRISAANPNDENAKAFYSLATMWTETGDGRSLVKAAAIAEEVFAANPNHPGAAHYLVHAYDTPTLAPLGLRAALVYGEMAPDATHALHMPSHIYVALGMWEEASNMNIRSYASAKTWGAKRNGKLNLSGAHATQWLQYSFFQEGKLQQAKAHFIEMQAATQKNPGLTVQFIQSWATYMVETDYGDSDFVNMELDTSKLNVIALLDYFYTQGVVAAKAGNKKAAEKALKDIAAIKPPSPGGRSRWSEGKRDISVMQIQAYMALSDGDKTKALNILEQAASTQTNIIPTAGLPSPVKPSAELYGELLVEMGQMEAAKTQFKTVLKNNVGRSKSLLGLAKATTALGQTEEAEAAYAVLNNNWKNAD